MTMGPLLFVTILAVAALVWAAQRLASRRVRALQGTPLPPLPPPFDALDTEDVLLWFHSPTCGHCRAMRPHIDALQARGRAVAIDVVDHPEVAVALNIMATPTTLRVQAGRVTDVHTTALSAGALDALTS